MEIKIPYGKTEICLSVPERNLFGVISDDNIEKEKTDEVSIIKRALNHPIKSPRIIDLAGDKSSACVLASDITRPCPSYRFLPYIIDELNAGGIYDIKVVFGLGIHRKQTRKEKLSLVGGYVAKKAVLVDSDASRCRALGYTSRGTPVEIFGEVLDADLLIATGNIEYHYYAGYSGGAKALMPGVSSYVSIVKNHSLMLSEKSFPGNYYTNPVRMDIEEAGKIAGLDFIFNVILDSNKNIIDAVAGANNEAFIEGMARYDLLFKKEVREDSGIVIVSPGGYPKDINLYQSHKAMENVRDIVAPGGKLILVAQCPEGIGESNFEKWMHKSKDYLSLREQLLEEFILGAHKAVAISRIRSRAEILLFSDFDDKKTKGLGFKKIFDLQEYIDEQLSLDDSIKVTVVPAGRVVSKIS